MSDVPASGVPAEEPWEGQIGSLLAGLPTVDPPAGFMAEAIDHRPLYAGRTLLGLVAVAVVALGAAMVTGVATRASVTPELDELARRHDSVVQAGVLGSLVPDGGPGVETPVSMPVGFERTGNVAAEDLRQAVYGRGDEAVSVFVQDGSPAWTLLPTEGLTTVDGMTAWVDENRRIVVLEADGQVVTIVGLSGEEVADVVAAMPRRGPSIGRRATDTVRSITGQLGFPD